MNKLSTPIPRPAGACCRAAARVVLNDACRHMALIDVSSYSAETEVP